MQEKQALTVVPCDSLNQTNQHSFFLDPQSGNPSWNSLDAPETMLYPWDELSTYIKHPPFFANMVSPTSLYSEGRSLSTYRKN